MSRNDFEPFAADAAHPETGWYLATTAVTKRVLEFAQRQPALNFAGARGTVVFVRATTVGTSGTPYELREDTAGRLTIWIPSAVAGDMELRGIAHAEDFVSAADDEDEEIRVLMADARDEFGI